MKIAILLRTGVLTLLLFIGVKANAQDDFDNPLLGLGVELFNLGTYDDALDIFLQVLQDEPNNAHANLYAGRSFLFTVSRKFESVDYLLKANEIKPEISRDIYFLIAEGYRYGFKFDVAKEYYSKFSAYVASNPEKFNDGRNYQVIADHRVNQCNNAIELTANPTDDIIENMGSTVNSIYGDYAPTINDSEDVLIFTSRRDESTDGFKDLDNKFFEDIYICSKTDTGWSKPVSISPNINSRSHESNIGLSHEGDHLFIYTGYNGGDIFISDLKNGEWTKPSSISKNVNTPFKETSAYLSKDGTKLFFSSNREDGVGKMDIYISEKDDKGNWDIPANIGGTINTEFDEESPFYDEGSKTLYFSSKGHSSMGGYDIFKSKYDPDHEVWSEPVNLGYPINTPDDDIYLVVTPDSKTGYYASHRKDSFGENDLYKITFVEKEEIIVEDKDTTKQRKGDAVVRLNIEVIDAATEEYFKSAMVQVVDRHTDKTLYEKHSLSGKLSFQFKDEEPTQLLVYAEAPGYKYRGLLIEIPGVGEEDIEINERIYIKEFELNKPYILRNVYFGFDHSHLKPESKYEIDKIVKMLTENPNMVIQISGHTDYVGSDDYNLELSTRRAKAVVAYLISRGIDKHRLKAVGYGKTRPIASNDDETDGRELNRRTEIVILKK